MSERREAMLEAARQALVNAHAPYSHFRVGACVRTAGGLYAGLHAGRGWTGSVGGSALTILGAVPALVSAHNLGADGPLFGAHLGYNWQVTPKSWVM